MAFLGSKACHEECGVRIMDYLRLDKDGNYRAIGFDCIGLGNPDVAESRWAAMMDSTRILSGNHTPWKGKPCVTYQHFVISPDPRDGVGLEELRSLTMEWAQEFFGTQMDAGRLGSYEVAIVYHDDNEKHIPHAHVIVNNTNFETGNRLHINDHESHLLTERLQEICKERGLTYFDESDAESHLNEEGRYYTKAERNLLRDGRFSWKQDIANNVAVARRLSRSEDEFLATCMQHGIAVEQRDGDYVFTHYHNEDRWKVSGYRLGRYYTRDHILEELDKNAVEFDDGLADLRENVSRHIVADLFEDMELVAVVNHGTTVREVAFTLKVNDQYKIRSLADYNRRIQQYEVRAATSIDKTAVKDLERTLGELKAARSIAEKGDFFESVDLGRPSTEFFSVAPGGAKSHGDTAEGGGRVGSGGKTRSQTREHQRSSGKTVERRRTGNNDMSDSKSRTR